MDKALRFCVIMAEDASALRSYAIFLKGCQSTMLEIDSITDFETPSNLKIIVSKLLFNLSEKWSAVVDNIYDEYKQGSTFRDSLAFIDKQS